jgi:hypothetical protein
MKRIAVAVAASAIAVAGVGLVAPAAHADGLGGVSGWEPSPTVCGRTNYVPLVISNATDQDQTGSVTVPYGTATQVGIFTSEDGVYTSDSLFALNLSGQCPNMTYQSPGQEYSENFTVSAGDTSVFWVALGGLDENLIGDSHKIGFGGLPENTPGQSWYDLQLNLTATESFGNLAPMYSWTGGTNTDNNQNGFNLVRCDLIGGVFTTDQVLTPYARGYSPSNIPAYSSGDPICAAWLPVGAMLPVSEANVEVGVADGYSQGIVGTINGFQENATSPTYNIAGTFTSPAAAAETTTVHLYNWTTGEPISVSANGTGSGANAFWSEDGWALQNVPGSPGNTIALWVEGNGGYGSQVLFTIPS